MARPDASIQKAHPCDPWVLMVVHLLGTVKHAGGGGGDNSGAGQTSTRRNRAGMWTGPPLRGCASPEGGWKDSWGNASPLGPGRSQLEGRHRAAQVWGGLSQQRKSSQCREFGEPFSYKHTLVRDLNSQCVKAL